MGTNLTIFLIKLSKNTHTFQKKNYTLMYITRGYVDTLIV
jgi:hypothetical protein